MNILDFIVSIKKIFGHENPWVNVLMVFLFAIIITVITIVYVWFKGEMRKKTHSFRI